MHAITGTSVQQLNGFKLGDRVSITDAVAQPPQVYSGEIKNLFDHGYAHVVYDIVITPRAKHNLEDNGMVSLTKLYKH